MRELVPLSKAGASSRTPGDVRRPGPEPAVPHEAPRSKDRHQLSLAASLLLNVSMIAYLAQSGGLRRIFLKLDVVELPKTRAEFQKEMEARYRKIPTTPAEVVFAGDSLVADGPWAEFFTEVHNRGIGGDTAAGLLGRLDEVTEGKPRKLFILVGANDLAAAVPDAQFLRHYREILERVRRESPEPPAITVLGVLPINPTFSKVQAYDNARVAETNRRLKELVGEFPGVRFLDLGPIRYPTTRATSAASSRPTACTSTSTDTWRSGRPSKGR